MTDTTEVIDGLREVGKVVGIYAPMRVQMEMQTTIDKAIYLLKLTKPTSGEWLYDRPHHFKCSVCGWMGGVSVTGYKYCPHCGSMMFLSEKERRKEWAD